MIKTLIEIIVASIGILGISFICALIQYTINDTPKHREEHRKRVYEWLLGMRKDFPRLLFVLSSLFLFSDSSCAGDERPIIHLSAQQVASAQARGIKICNGQNETPDERAEMAFAENNMVINAQGGREVRPIATGHRQVISSRLAVNEVGQLEGIPTIKEMGEYEDASNRVRELGKAYTARLKKLTADLPESDQIVAEADAVLKQGSKKMDDKISDWKKDKDGTTAKYEVQAVLKSYETKK